MRDLAHSSASAASLSDQARAGDCTVWRSELCSDSISRSPGSSAAMADAAANARMRNRIASKYTVK
jgi:hypothetical protein